jgi:hypothetical protein
MEGRPGQRRAALHEHRAWPAEAAHRRVMRDRVSIGLVSKLLCRQRTTVIVAEEHLAGSLMR